jgi:hypothetical protein
MSSTLGYSTLENIDNDDSGDQENFINQRRQLRNSTRKRRESFTINNKSTQNKLNPAILEQMHNMSNDDEEDGLFPPKPQSAGVEKTKEQEEKKQSSESMVNMSNDVMFRTLGKPPQPNYEGDNNLDLNDYSIYGDEKKNDEYYRRVLPGYPQQKQSGQNLINKPYYSQVNYQIPETNDSILLQKMNYMITLLEDQQDERTNNVTEEVILYSFLGVFIIFIADTFVRAGKYVR